VTNKEKKIFIISKQQAQILPPLPPYTSLDAEAIWRFLTTNPPAEYSDTGNLNKNMTGHKLKLLDEIQLFTQKRPEEMYIDEKEFFEGFTRQEPTNLIEDTSTAFLQPQNIPPKLPTVMTGTISQTDLQDIITPTSTTKIPKTDHSSIDAPQIKVLFQFLIAMQHYKMLLKDITTRYTFLLNPTLIHTANLWLQSDKFITDKENFQIFCNFIKLTNKNLTKQFYHLLRANQPDSKIDKDTFTDITSLINTLYNDQPLFNHLKAHLKTKGLFPVFDIKP
jgi:hypothetical protein